MINGENLANAACDASDNRVPCGSLVVASRITQVDDRGKSEFGVLFNGKGVETTYYLCSACHSERLVAQQGLTREGWEEVIDWMVEEQGMSELEPDEQEEILDYLSRYYNTDRPNFPKGQNR